MKLYTKTGDQGETSLFGGQRISKSNLRIDAYGTVDELNSFIGLVRDQEININHKTFLIEIQKELFVIGAFLATPQEDKILKNGKSRIETNEDRDEQIKNIERKIDELDTQLSPITHFVLPGGHVSISHCHVARAVCRRAERICILLNENKPINKTVIIYLNRLSDYLFVLARILTKELQVKETKWIPNKL